jgi:hypothetical protein
MTFAVLFDNRDSPPMMETGYVPLVVLEIDDDVFT